MQLETRKYLDRIKDVNSFLDARATFLATWPKIATFRADLNAAEAAIIAASTAQGNQSSSGSGQVALKQTPLAALETDLRDMARTAKQIDLEIPGTGANFIYPTSGAELAIIGAARVFLQKVSGAQNAALKAEFIAYGMPADFATDLEEDIARYDAMSAAQTGAQQGASLALKTLDGAIAQSSQSIDQLDAMVRNIYARSPAEIASWKEAKRLRDIRAHRATPAPVPPAK